MFCPAFSPFSRGIQCALLQPREKHLPSRLNIFILELADVQYRAGRVFISCNQVTTPVSSYPRHRVGFGRMSPDVTPGGLFSADAGVIITVGV